MDGAKKDMHDRLVLLAQSALDEIEHRQAALEDRASSVFFYHEEEEEEEEEDDDDDNDDGERGEDTQKQGKRRKVGGKETGHFEVLARHQPDTLSERLVVGDLVKLGNPDAVARAIDVAPLLPHAGASARRPWVRRVKGGLRWTRGDEKKFLDRGAKVLKSRWDSETLEIRRREFLAPDVVQGPFCAREDKVLKEFVQSSDDKFDWAAAAMAVSESNKAIVCNESRTEKIPPPPWRRGAWSCLCRYQSVLQAKDKRKLSAATDAIVHKIVNCDPDGKVRADANTCKGLLVPLTAWSLAGEAVARPSSALRKRFWQQSRSGSNKSGAAVKWSNEEDRRLQQAVVYYSSPTPQWSLIQRHLPGKSDKACRIRYQQLEESPQKKH